MKKLKTMYKIGKIFMVMGQKFNVVKLFIFLKATCRFS